MRIPPQSSSNYTKVDKSQKGKFDTSAVEEKPTFGFNPKIISVFETKKADGTTGIYIGGGAFITKDGRKVRDSFPAQIEIKTKQKPENRSALSYGDDLATSLIIARNVVADGSILKPREIDILKNAGATAEQITTLQALPIAKKGSSETKIAQSTVTKKEDNFEPRTAKSTFAKNNDVATNGDYSFA